MVSSKFEVQMYCMNLFCHNLF